MLQYAPSYWCTTWTVCASAGYTRCSGRTSVYLCASLLQNLAAPQGFYFPLSVPLERSCRLRNRRCGTGGFSRAGPKYFIGRGCSIPFSLLLFCHFSSFVDRLVLRSWGLLTEKVHGYQVITLMKHVYQVTTLTKDG